MLESAGIDRLPVLGRHVRRGDPAEPQAERGDGREQFLPSQPAILAVAGAAEEIGVAGDQHRHHVRAQERGRHSARSPVLGGRARAFPDQVLDALLGERVEYLVVGAAQQFGSVGQEQGLGVDLGCIGRSVAADPHGGDTGSDELGARLQHLVAVDEPGDDLVARHLPGEELQRHLVPLHGQPHQGCQHERTDDQQGDEAGGPARALGHGTRRAGPRRRRRPGLLRVRAGAARSGSTAR